MIPVETLHSKVILPSPPVVPLSQPLEGGVAEAPAGASSTRPAIAASSTANRGITRVRASLRLVPPLFSLRPGFCPRVNDREPHYQRDSAPGHPLLSVDWESTRSKLTHRNAPSDNQPGRGTASAAARRRPRGVRRSRLRRRLRGRGREGGRRLPRAALPVLRQQEGSLRRVPRAADRWLSRAGRAGPGASSGGPTSRWTSQLRRLHHRASDR